MLAIERITTPQEVFLLIHAENKGIRIYEWISGAWEPAEAAKAAGVIMSGNACSQGILSFIVRSEELLHQ